MGQSPVTYQITAGVGAPTSNFTSARVRHSGIGVNILLAVNVLDAGQTITLIQTVTDPAGNIFTILLGAVISQVGLYLYQLAPGATLSRFMNGTTIQSVAFASSREFQIQLVFGDLTGIPEAEYNLSYSTLG